jgi:hypothetical protein
VDYKLNFMKKLLLFVVIMLTGILAYCQPAARGELFQRDSAVYKPPSDKFQLMAHTNKDVVYWDGTKWRTIVTGSSSSALPSQTGHNGHYLGSNGTTALWKDAFANPVIPALKYNATATTNFFTFPTGERLFYMRGDSTYSDAGRGLTSIQNANYYWGRNAGSLTSTGGGSNLGLMDSALVKITSGFGNIALGEQALANATNSNYSVGIGYFAGNKNNASGLIAIGDKAFVSNTTGGFNIGIGTSAGLSNTTGASNVLVGTSNFQYTRVGSFNTGMGSGVFAHLDSGSNNTGFGWHIHHYGTLADNNTYVGYGIAETASGDNNNAFFGYAAGKYVTNQDSMIILNSLDRTNYTGDTANSPIVIFENTSLASQRIKLNGDVYVNGNLVPTILTGSATLSFPTFGANQANTLTITVNGAADGDVVALGTPNAATIGTTTGIVYFAWVSGTNTVSIKAVNTSGGPLSPVSSTFKVKVFK